MAFVVTESCIQCKFTDCIAACPVDCFRDGPNFLVIDPDECIDCGACVPECPVDAIFDVVGIPEEWVDYIEINATLALLWPSITDAVDPLATAEAWRDTEGKAEWLELDAEAAQALGRSVQGPAPAEPPEVAASTAPLPAKAPIATPYAHTPEANDAPPAPEAKPSTKPSIGTPSPTATKASEPSVAPPPAPASGEPASASSLSRRLARKVLPSSVRGSLKSLLRRR